MRDYRAIHEGLTMYRDDITDALIVLGFVAVALVLFIVVLST